MASEVCRFCAGGLLFVAVWARSPMRPRNAGWSVWRVSNADRNLEARVARRLPDWAAVVAAAWQYAEESRWGVADAQD